MSDMRTFQEYRESVESFAREVFDRTKEGDDESDALHEAVDSADWIIYTYHAQAVLAHSRNDDCIFDEMGRDALDGCESMVDVYTRAAFYAMRADVAECLNDNREEWEAESEPKEAE